MTNEFEPDRVCEEYLRNFRRQTAEREAWLGHVRSRVRIDPPDSEVIFRNVFVQRCVVCGLITADKRRMAKARILHVDDDPDVRLMISASLQEFGYSVATAATSSEALQLAQQLEFDLCILDVRLPDENGIELCQRIHKEQPQVPVLYYSAYASEKEQEAALSVCGQGYLKKPISAAKLEETIAGLLESCC